MTGYSEAVEGVGSADTVIYQLGMFNLESVFQSDIFQNVLRLFQWK
jgi:hypothetical protein